jgi:hypothetical protein
MVMMCEGVHTGNNGPLYYPASELQKFPMAWNMKPVVVYHPKLNGQELSACDTAIAEKQQVGFIMNTHYDDKLRAEAWLDEERLQAVDSRVLEALQQNTLMEVSTGVFTENMHKPGEFDGQPYDFIACNYRPDHLAILPDEKGACSIAKGAGLLQLNAAGSEGPPGAMVQRWVDTAISGVRGMVVNALSNDDKHSQLRAALRRRFATTLFIVDVFERFVVFEVDEPANRGLQKIGYTVKNDTVALAGEPMQVNRTTAYRTLEGKLVTNQHPTEDNMATREEAVDALIANEGTAWAPEDRDALLQLNDEQVAKLQPAEEPEEETTTPAAAADPTDPNPAANRQAVQAAAEQGA